MIHTHTYTYTYNTCIHLVYVNWMPSVIEIKSLSTNIHTYNNIEHLLKKQKKEKRINQSVIYTLLIYLSAYIHTYIHTILIQQHSRRTINCCVVHTYTQAYVLCSQIFYFYNKNIFFLLIITVKQIDNSLSRSINDRHTTIHNDLYIT